MRTKKLPPIHPGEILREEFLVPLNLTPLQKQQLLAFLNVALTDSRVANSTLMAISSSSRRRARNFPPTLNAGFP